MTMLETDDFTHPGMEHGKLPPYGCQIQYSNSGKNPCWLVMRWQEIKYVSDTLQGAYEWLADYVTQEDEEA